MNHRLSSSPILWTVALSLSCSPQLVRAQMEQGTTAPTISVPAPSPAPAATPAPVAPPAADTTTETERPATYTVVSGDSLWLIAQKFHCSVSSLKKLNKMKNNNLKPGQVLQIPPLKTKASPTPSPTAKTTSVEPATEPEVNTAPVAPAAEPEVKAASVASASVAPTPVKHSLASQAIHFAKAGAIAAQASHQAKTISPTTRAIRMAKAAAVAATPQPKVAETTHSENSPSENYPKAQPVQAFDSASLSYAPQPAPASEPEHETTTATTPEPVAADTAPRAQPVSPEDLAQSPAPSTTTESTPAEEASTHSVATNSSSKHPGERTPWSSVTDNESSAPTASEEASGKPSASRSNLLFTTPSSDWATRFRKESEALAAQGIEYDEDWRPPGETHSWAMDCSNTSRYIYKITTGIELPRTASDQYYYLHLQNKAWDVPEAANGFADTNYLRENLKPGDLLFWENTYRPERQPPITHVMVFLGTNEKGQWIMAGSQTSRGGEHNRSHGGPDIYVFDPTKPCGGYSTWLGMVHHQGRFCAYGRPLEADKSKLAVAAND